MSNLFSIRKIIKLPSTELIDSKMNLKVEKEELLEEGWLVGLASSYVIRTLDVITGTGYDEGRVQRLKKAIRQLTESETNKANLKQYIKLKDE